MDSVELQEQRETETLWNDALRSLGREERRRERQSRWLVAVFTAAAVTTFVLILGWLEGLITPRTWWARPVGAATAPVRVERVPVPVVVPGGYPWDPPSASQIADEVLHRLEQQRQRGF